MFSLCGTFLEVLVQTIGKGESGTFRTVGIIRTKFFFQFALVAVDFRSLQMIVEQTDCLVVNVDITPQAAVVGIWVGDELLLLDRRTQPVAKDSPRQEKKVHSNTAIRKERCEDCQYQIHD